jgi:hypothetical protein
MMTRRSWAVYGLLAAIWVTLIGWQTAEHLRARKAFHNMLIDRGRGISDTGGVMMRNTRFIGRSLSRERLEAALKELVASDTNALRSVELLNRDGEAVASAGPPIEMPPRSDFDGAVFWGGPIAIIQNPIDLGTNLTEIVMPEQEARSIINAFDASSNGVAVTNDSTINTNFPRARARPPRYDWRREAFLGDGAGL